MKMSIVTSIVLMLAMGAHLQAASPQPQSASFDKAGPYLLKQDSSAQERSELQAKMRAWLWQHWQLKHRGQLLLTEYFKGGESNLEYMVEPDSKGIWQISIRIHSVTSDPWYASVQYKQDKELHAYNVERIKIDTDSPAGTPLTADMIAPPGAYRLLFKDDHNQRLQVF